MKVAIVSPYPIDAPGGVQRHILDYYERLKKLNHYVKIISPSKTYKHPDHIRVGKAYKLQGEIFNGSTTYWARTNMLKFRSKLHDNFDIIHIHEPFLVPPFFYGYRILKNNRAHYVAHIHAMNPIFEETEMLVNPMIRRIMSDFNAIIASSEESAKPYRFLNKEIYVIPNGVEVEKLNPNVQKAKEYLDGKKNILFVGRFDERKGLRYLLEAWSIISNEFSDNVRLIIVGKGKEKDQEDIDQIVETLPNRENIIFEGHVTEERKAQLYATADIFCSPATGRESFGMVLNEAMAAGTPVVAFDNPGYRTVLGEKKDDCLARLFDIIDLSAKIIRFLKNPDLQKEIIEWGLKEVQTKYDWRIVSKQVLKIYDKVLREPIIEQDKQGLFDYSYFGLNKTDFNDLRVKFQQIFVR